MSQPTTHQHAQEASMFRLIGAGLLVSIAALVVFHAGEFWAVPGLALVQFLSLQPLVPLSPSDALLIAHGMAGGWGMWLGAALVVYTIKDPTGAINQTAMYLLLLVSLGVWFALLQLMVQLQVDSHWYWLSVPGALGVVLTTAAAIFFSGVHELGDDVEVVKSIPLPGGRSGDRQADAQA